MKTMIEKAWDDRALLEKNEYTEAVREVVRLLDQGELRAAEPAGEGWQVNEWVKKAILLYFKTSKMEPSQAGPFRYYDKIPLKGDYAERGVRVVPHAVARYGAYLAKGVVMMPSYVNIGAYVDSGTMVDTWATVGSCAQIGKNVHLSGGVGIGGVLEPLQAAPVIVEDHCFIGSRCIVVEGAHIETEAVLDYNDVARHVCGADVYDLALCGSLNVGSLGRNVFNAHLTEYGVGGIYCVKSAEVSVDEVIFEYL